MTAPTQFVTLRAAIAALLAANPPLAGGRIEQNRTFELPVGMASQIHVNLAGSQIVVELIGAAHPKDWDTDIEIRIKARKAGVDEADAVRDALWADIYSRVMGGASAIAGVQSITPGSINWDDDEADTSVASLTAYFTLRHETADTVIT